MPAAAARWPLTTAPSIVAGSPVSVQSPASTNPLTPVRADGRGGWPGASENVARRSRTTRLRSRRAARAAGQRGRQLVVGQAAPAGRSTRPRRPRRRSTRTRGARPNRRTPGACRTPTGTSRPGQADERRRQHAAVEPEVHRDDGRRGACATRRQASRPGRTRHPSACRRARTMAPQMTTAGAAIDSPRASTRATRPSSTTTLRRAGRPHLAAARLDERARRLGVDGRQGPQRHGHRGVDAGRGRASARARGGSAARPPRARAG